MEQRVNIKFCFKLGRTATETQEMLVKVDAVSKKCVFEWFKRFRDGKEDAKDEPRSGRPPTSTTPDNIERVRRMLADDRRLSLRTIAEELKISLDSVSNIIHEHLQKRKMTFQQVLEVLEQDKSINEKVIEIMKEYDECLRTGDGMRDRKSQRSELSEAYAALYKTISEALQ
ncbi:Putative uncharacterized protein FLJ37770 [Araneus ventricosus]|uniref:Mos1 transposase HTH domain-containing protein n=1 Tax=Araneus ventricosus TaxID=182803 RepID=A0A4Y2ILM6_ARAVE|nr:Putative uncharacterized protein FLJ37770 [Araneus ventricosus]